MAKPLASHAVLSLRRLELLGNSIRISSASQFHTTFDGGAAHRYVTSAVLGRASQSGPVSTRDRRPESRGDKIGGLGSRNQVRSFSGTHAAPRMNTGMGGPNRTRLPLNLGIMLVPTQQAYVVERFGRFDKILQPGLNLLIPFVDRVAYVQSLKETAIEIPAQMAITADNVGLQLDGVLYLKVFEPYKASYGVQDAFYAVSQLAMTTMRSEIGSMTLDETLKERANLNIRITEAINTASADWGVTVLRYEIKDITPPHRIVEAMALQVSAERTKRAQVLEAEGKKQSAILVSEARQAEQVNVARGEAGAIALRAQATAEAVRKVGEAISSAHGGKDAVALKIAGEWVEAFGKLAKEGNSVIVPASLDNAGGMIAQALSIFDTLSRSRNLQSAPPSERLSAPDAPDSPPVSQPDSDPASRTPPDPAGVASPETAFEGALRPPGAMDAIGRPPEPGDMDWYNEQYGELARAFGGQQETTGKARTRGDERGGYKA